MTGRALVAALALALCLPAAASGHALVRLEGSTLTYTATDVSDASARNTTTIELKDANTIRISDPTVSGGMDPGHCVPITEAQVECPRSGVSIIRADVGLGDDTVALSVPIPSQLIGGDGSDRLTGGPSADLIVGGRGTDTIDGGAGDDDIRSRDGEADQVGCGDGTDTVLADTLDEIQGATGCERVDRGSGQPGGEADTTAPVLSASGLSVQRASRRPFTVVATVDEPGTVTASATVLVSGRRRPIRLRDKTYRVTVAGGGIEARFRLPRAASRALRGRGRVVARVVLAATDEAGNRSKARTLRIRLRR
ncbi:MAG TPA: hypothetical protein VNT32_02275 [Thermoleophilaceae bacterium]|nr:hypothetical protein [Thermoleophilaceae bacterium]